MTTNLTITKAGQEAIELALMNSDNAVTITTVAVGAGDKIIPFLDSVTALQKEISRTAFVGDSDSMPAGVAGYGLFEGGEAWAAWEVGIFARSGDSGHEFLFAYAQAANNASGIKMALLVKDADEPARYDFSLVFAPGALAPRAPKPAPCPPTVIRFATDDEAKSRMPMDAALKPNQQQQWRSINKRAPTMTDASFPVGHLWMHDKDEWVLESHTDTGTAQWRQIRGTKLIYTAATAPSSVRQTLNVSMSDDLTEFSQLFFHPFVESYPNLSNLDLDGPIAITMKAFMNGEDAYVNRDEYKTAFARYVNSHMLSLYNEFTVHYINKIYGVY